MGLMTEPHEGGFRNSLHLKAGCLTMMVPDHRVPRLVWAMQLALLRPSGRSQENLENIIQADMSLVTSMGSETHMRPPREKGGLSPPILVCKMGTVVISQAPCPG